MDDLAGAPEYDVFVSYSHQDPDLTWVRQELVPRLRAAGLRVCLDPPDWMRRLARPRLGIRARLWLDMTSDAEIETQIDRLVATIRASAGTG
jgi:hypothetical protein